MRCAVIGSVESSRAAVRALASVPGVALVAVVTLPPALAARHSDFVDLAPDAAAAGARLLHAADANAPELVATLADLDLDYLFVIGWSQLCRAPLLGAARRGVIGYHPTPLPRLRGRAAIPWTILLDEKITAGTLFWIDAGTDTGPILRQRFFHIVPGETAAGLYALHLRIIDELLREAAPLLAGPAPPRQPQDERCATWAAKRRPEDGQIDWGRPAAEVHRLVRAVGRPYPGAFTSWRGRRLILWRAAPWAEGGGERHVALPGQVVARDGVGFAIRCGDGRDLWSSEFAWVDGPADGPPPLHGTLGG
jgi:methionyl-tRNA formyltransferase